MTISLVQLLFLVIIFGLIYWLVAYVLPLPPPFKTVAIVILVLILIIILLNMVGLLGTSIRIGSLLTNMRTLA